MPLATKRIVFDATFRKLLKITIISSLAQIIILPIPRSWAAVYITADPIFLYQAFLFKRGYIPSDLSVGMDVFLTEKISIGPEFSMFQMYFPSTNIHQNGYEFGIRGKYIPFSFNEYFSLMLSPNAGYSLIKFRREAAQPWSEVQGLYVGLLSGVFINLKNIINLFIALGPKYYFHPESKDGLPVHRSGFHLDAEGSIGIRIPLLDR